MKPSIGCLCDAMRFAGTDVDGRIYIVIEYLLTEVVRSRCNVHGPSKLATSGLFDCL